MRDTRSVNWPEIIDGLAICVDCAMAAANGTGPARETGTRLWYQLWRSATRRMSEWYLVVTCCGDGDSCAGFSWSRCDYCRGTLGGDRHTAALIRRAD